MTGSRSNRWHFAVALVLAAVLAPGPGSAAPAGSETGPAARADAARSGVATAWFGRRLSFQLQLDRPVPFRVFTLDAPPRLVADVAGLDWSGFGPAAVTPVLVELGFLSNPADRAAMTSPVWRRGAARAVRDGLGDWLASEAAGRSGMKRLLHQAPFRLWGC